eukprot:TRINITY_DN7016_c0_g1_i1.p1 TRINITY_DN7016_c0_g1~~TRINITY_DN7016_c0_g1_i1.p1  ORF type:complete len:103 (+),score=10.26 TRINITY_DN7016_c0_g1_i1:96-404(+)
MSRNVPCGVCRCGNPWKQLINPSSPDKKSSEGFLCGGSLGIPRCGSSLGRVGVGAEEAVDCGNFAWICLAFPWIWHGFSWIFNFSADGIAWRETCLIVPLRC